MSSQITNVIPMEPAAARQANRAAGEPPATNRAAWPTGSMLACAVVSHRFGNSITYCPAIDATTDRAPAAAEPIGPADQTAIEWRFCAALR